MELKEKAAYLKGLAEGLNYDKTTAEGQLIGALIDLCSTLAKELEETKEDVNYVSEYVEEIDQDLGDVEEYLYGDEDDDEFDDEDFEDEDDAADEENSDN